MRTEDATNGTILQKVANDTKAALVVPMPRGRCYFVSPRTGLMTAGAAADGTIYARRLDPSAGAIESVTRKLRVRVDVTTAFTTAADLSLRLVRGSGAAATGGNQITVARQGRSTDAVSECNAAAGGDIRIATTAILGVVGITFDAESPANIGLGFAITPRIVVAAAAIGNAYDITYDFDDRTAPYLVAGELLALRLVAAAGATGVWAAQIEESWEEYTPSP